MNKDIIITEDNCVDIIIEKDKEIERLNNIIDEIEDYLSRFLYMLNGITDRDIYEQCQLDDFTQVLDKLKELRNKNVE